MRAILTVAMLCCLGTVGLGVPPYEENVDAQSAIRTARAEAERAGLPLMIVFGANWCNDSMTLDHAIKRGMASSLIAKNFKVVQIDVGHRDRNVDIASSYGVSLSKGIPAFVVLTNDGKVAYATKSGELSSAQKMGDKNLHNFFVKTVSQFAGNDADATKKSDEVAATNPSPQKDSTVQTAPPAPTRRVTPSVAPRRYNPPNRPRVFAPRR